MALFFMIFGLLKGKNPRKSTKVQKEMASERQKSTFSGLSRLLGDLAVYMRKRLLGNLAVQYEKKSGKIRKRYEVESSPKVHKVHFTLQNGEKA